MNTAAQGATPAARSGPDRQAIKRLFRPGPGTAPPVLAGRAHEQEALGALLSDLRAGEPVREAVLFGPRGNGKTVLLDRFRADCRAAGVATLALEPSAIDNLGALALALLEPPTPPAQADPSVTDNLGAGVRRGADAVKRALPGAGALHLSGVQAGVPGARLILEQVPTERLVASLPRLLAERCRETPLVVTIDEAHRLDPKAGERLLNLSQRLRGDKVPFLLVMAGTPDLEARLGAVSATFWDRAGVMGLGRLEEDPTREALTVPLAAHGVTVDDAALDEVVRESQQYPYFIQLWGKALCEALVAQGGRRIDAGIVDAARPAFAETRTFYYHKRHTELADEALLDAAAVVARACLPDPDGPPAAWPRPALQALLVEELGLPPGVKQPGGDPDVAPGTALYALRRLAHLGFLWTPYGKNRLEPGIPSLMTYVLAEDGRAPAPAPVAAPGPG